jgi:iron complex outermembrane receptor protein
MKIKHLQSALKVGLGTAAFITTVPAAHAQEAAGGLEQVFVTARKRDEGVQAVPIAITAFSADALQERGVREMQDLNLVVPGFRFGTQGGKANNDVILRGLAKIPLGEGMPAVVTYFNNVALPARGSNIPAYDIANMQVLKGPQGTLFGRNTLGGAVVIASEAPTYEVGGYLKGVYGTKAYRNLEGAVNVPVIDEKLAFRFAGQIRRQDGLAKNLSGGPDFDNTHQNSYRISALFQPTDSIESTTVYDHFQADEIASAGYLYSMNESVWDQPTDRLYAFTLIPAANAALPGPAKTFADQIRAYVAAGHDAGIHAAFSQLPEAGAAKRKLWGISNDTAWDTGAFTVRNIFGYRNVSVQESISTGSTGPTTVAMPVAIGPFPAGTAIPITLFNAAQNVEREYWSDEFQLFGNAFDDRLDWIIGAYYNKDQSTDPQGSTFTAFSFGGVPSPAIAAHVKNVNKAVFGQIGLDISEWTTEGLKFNLGVRYSKDDTSGCGGAKPGAPAEYLSASECDSIAKQNVTSDGVGIVNANSNEISYTTGLDWQINPDTLAYLTTRRGYRGVNVNTPLFETQFTTGGTGCPTNPGGVCPDLRPFQTTDPEYLTDYEIGVKNDWQVGDVKGRLNVAAYIAKLKDSVQFVNYQGAGIPNGTPDSPTNGSVGVNAGDLTTKGVEADLTVIPVPSLTLSFSGAYTDQKIDSLKPGVDKHDVTLQSPKFSGTLAFSWITPVKPLDGDLVFSGDYYHTDKFSGQHGVNLPGYEVANFRLAWNGIAKTKLDVAVYVKNAFDEEYFASPVVNSPSFPMVVYIPGEARNWGVEANYKF